MTAAKLGQPYATQAHSSRVEGKAHEARSRVVAPLSTAHPAVSAVSAAAASQAQAGRARVNALSAQRKADDLAGQVEALPRITLRQQQNN